MANSWGESGTTWSQGDWGQQNVTTVSISGFSITATLDDLAYAASTAGWSRDSWGENDWGDSSLSIPVTGLSMTGSLGTPVASSEQGWGRATWGNEPWGDSSSPVISVSGFSITAALGTLPYAQSEEGWGRDEWGYGNWGENTTTVIVDGLEMTGRFGPDGWGQSKWGEEVSWGGDLTLTTTQLTIAAITGIEMTGSLGTPTLNYDFIFTLDDSLLLTASRGSLSINNGADHTQGLGGIAMTGSLGTPVHEMTYALTGIEATLSLGTAVANNAEIIDVTGIEATGSLGTPVLEFAYTLTGIAGTMSLGTPVVTDMQVGVSGFEVTSTLGSGGVSPLHYKDVDITGNTSYTYVEHSA